MIKTVRDWWRHHHHSWATAERTIIDFTMPTSGPGARIDRSNVDESTPPSAANDAAVEVSLASVREQRDKIDFHHGWIRRQFTS
jgi:hypothetical protein